MMESEDMFEYREDDLNPPRFSDLRESGEPCDVTIRAGTEYLPAHRRVLASRIPFFRHMFGSQMMEATAKEIFVGEVHPALLECVVNFAYTNELKIESDKVPALLEACIYMQQDTVGNACLNFLRERIDSVSVLKLRECAVILKNADVVKKADEYVAENFDDVCHSEEFLDIPFRRLKEIIQRDDLNALNEEAVYESVITWVKASEPERRLRLPELLRHVRMTLLAPEYLSAIVSTEELIRTSSVCKDIVEVAKNYHVQGSDKSPCNFVTKQRYCKQKHHLRCAKLRGYGMYSACQLEDNVSLNYYDHINDRWTDLCSRTLTRSADYIVCTEEEIYIIAHRFIEIFYLKTLKSFSVKIQNRISGCAGITLHRDKIYFVGGFLDSSNLVHHLDPIAATYSAIGEIIAPRTGPGVVSYGDVIYITGGYTGRTVHSSAETYNPSTGESTKISSMCSRRWGHACATHNGKIYVSGGNVSKASPNNFNHFIKCAEVYEPVTDQWHLISEMNDIRRSVSLFSYDNKVHAVDADPQDGDRFGVEVFDPDENEWRLGESIKFTQRCQEAVVLLTNMASVFYYY